MEEQDRDAPIGETREADTEKVSEGGGEKKGEDKEVLGEEKKSW